MNLTFLARVILGQIVSLLLVGTGATAQLLADRSSKMIVLKFGSLLIFVSEDFKLRLFSHF